MGKRISKKEKGFAKDYVKTGNATEAIVRNYDVKDRNVARTMGAENLAKPRIQAIVKSIADQIPDSLLVEKHLALLNKEEVIIKNNMTSGIIDTIETGQIDSQSVAKGLEMAYKLKGSFAPEKKELTGANGQPLFMPSNEEQEKIDGLISKL